MPQSWRGPAHPRDELEGEGLEPARTSLGRSQPVGLQLDCFDLPYFERAPHFAGHFVAATRLIGDEVEVVDTLQQARCSACRVSRSKPCSRTDGGTSASIHRAGRADSTSRAIGGGRDAQLRDPLSCA